MGIPVRRGRAFTADDDATRPQVAVINEALARTEFSGVDPIGHVVSMPGMDGGSGTATIVGIVGDVRHRGPALPPVPEAYFSYRQRPRRTWSMTLVVTSPGGTDTAAEIVRARARTVDRQVPPAITTMASAMRPFVAPSAFRARLLAAVAGVALVLSFVGIAGVVAHGAERRRREMGIRAALGAQPGALVGVLVGSGMRPVVAGAIAGAVAAWSAASVLRAFVFDIGVRDRASLIAAVVAILVAGLVASWWPARRIARVDPALVLRV
jgi:hypothetical protein